MSKHPVDLYVGKRLKIARMKYGLSQEELGQKVGITFQQIQKYEKGDNRIAASRLYELARLLDCDANYFFEDYTDELSELNLSKQLDNELEYWKIQKAFCSLPKKIQKAFGNIIHEIALNLSED